MAVNCSDKKFFVHLYPTNLEVKLLIPSLCFMRYLRCQKNKLKKTALFLFGLISIFSTQAQQKRLIIGMYLQWGYNTEWYTKSNIHFKLANGDNFTLIKAKAHDKPDLDAILESPFEISIPQYNYRLGFYLNENKTKAVELNFDHIKYVVTDGQKVHVKGTINKSAVNGDSILNKESFLHLEHSDGGNLLHFNYVQLNKLLTSHKNGRTLINSIWKAGAGINIPRTDFTYRGDRFNNNFHISGYNVSAEGGARVYPFKKLFLEFTGKTGYVRYINALANTTQSKGSHVKHGFAYFELIGLIGYDLKFGKM